MKSLPLTIEAFCKSPSLSGPSPSGLKLAPDGSCLTFLRGRDDDKDYQDLWRLPLTDENGMSVSNPHPTLFVNADRLGLSGSDGSDLSAEEKARRERMRVAQSKGILQYYWSGNGEYLLIPAGNTHWIYQVSTGDLNMMPVSDVEKKGAVIDAQLSPNSDYVSYLREDNNLYIFQLSTQQEIAITTDGTSTIRNGVAEFVAQEEMSRLTGYWWSPQTKFLAFTRIDESYVENVQRNEVFADGVKMTYQRYPYAGKRNVRVQLGVVDLAKIDGTEADISSKMWIPLDQEEGTTDFYLPRVKWVSRGESEDEVLSYQYQSRDQKLLKLKLAEIERCFKASEFHKMSRFQLQDGGSEAVADLGALLPQSYTRTLLTESQQNAFVNLVGDDDLHFCRSESLRSQKIFFWLSERDNGFKSIFMGSYAKSVERKDAILFRLTDKVGDPSSPFFGHYYVVDSLEFVDEKNRHLYFTGRKTSPIEKHLYRLDFGELLDNNLIPRYDAIYDEDEFRMTQEKLNILAQRSNTYITQVTSRQGFHNISFSSNGKFPLFIDIFSSHEQPTQYSLWRAATEKSDFDNTEKNAEFITWVEENNFRQADHPLLPYYDKLNLTPEFGMMMKQRFGIGYLCPLMKSSNDV
jgi:dipeptidyl-peptidase-4